MTPITVCPPVTATPAKATTLTAAAPAGRLAVLRADRDHAHAAAAAPDVAQELRVHAARTAAALGLDPDDEHVIARLLDYGRGSYIHGHLDATTDHTPAPPLARLLNPHYHPTGTR